MRKEVGRSRKAAFVHQVEETKFTTAGASSYQKCRQTSFSSECTLEVKVEVKSWRREIPYSLLNH